MKKFLILGLLVLCAGNAYGMQKKSNNIFNYLVLGLKDEKDANVKKARKKEVDSFLSASGIKVQGGIKDAYEAAFGQGATPEVVAGGGFVWKSKKGNDVISDPYEKFEVLFGGAPAGVTVNDEDKVGIKALEALDFVGNKVKAELTAKTALNSGFTAAKSNLNVA